MGIRAIFAGLSIVACAGCSAEPSQEEVAAPVTAESEEAEYPVVVQVEEDVRHFLLQEYPEAAPMRYALALADLNGDGSDEAVVHVVSPYLCGSGGCGTLVLTPAGPMWRKVAEISVSRTPITMLESSTNGWRDITVEVSGGGGPSGSALLKFDGESYPGNPTVGPAEMTGTTGTELIAEEPEFKTLVAVSPSDQ